MRIPFDPSVRTALIVEMQVHGPVRNSPLRLRAAVDTGAHTILIPRAAARLLGYPLDGAESERIITGSGIIHAPRIVLDRVDVGPASVREVEAICHDLPRESMLDALVGLSFLTEFDVRLDFEAWEMEFARRRGTQPPSAT